MLACCLCCNQYLEMQAPIMNAEALLLTKAGSLSQSSAFGRERTYFNCRASSYQAPRSTGSIAALHAVIFCMFFEQHNPSRRCTSQGSPQSPSLLSAYPGALFLRPLLSASCDAFHYPAAEVTYEHLLDYQFSPLTRTSTRTSDAHQNLARLRMYLVIDSILSEGIVQGTS